MTPRRLSTGETLAVVATVGGAVAIVVREGMRLRERGAAEGAFAQHFGHLFQGQVGAVDPARAPKVLPGLSRAHVGVMVAGAGAVAVVAGAAGVALGRRSAARSGA